MEKIFEGAISCKALLEAGSRDCKKLYIDKKKNTKDTRYLAKIAKSKDCEVVFCSRDEINELARNFYLPFFPYYIREFFFT